MTPAVNVAAHLIIGAPDEPFLGALLTSLEGVAQTLIVNDNSPGESAHEATLQNSWFGRNGRLFLDRTPFLDYSTARNACMELHARHGAGEWVAFVDADEVHHDAARRIAHNLHLVPAEVDFIDGYTWHFFQSFDLYTSIERRMAFYRFAESARWSGRVHERLEGLQGRRLALPYVYAHYAHVLPARRHAEKGRRYSSLGQFGEVLAEEALASIDEAHYFRDLWPHVLRFHGEHPPAALPTIEAVRPSLAAQERRAAELVRAAQPAALRARNLLLQANYEMRWRSRAINPLARRILAR